MRPVLLTLVLLPLFLVGCEKPAPGDYWSDATVTGTSQPSAAEQRSAERAMADGTRANLAGRPSDAMALFREALKGQETRYGRGHPETALPLMSIALQLSVAGQFPEADNRFAEAERALRTSPDRAMKARLLHYRGEHLLNQKKPAEAEATLRAAQTAYTALLPEAVLTREPIRRLPPNRFDFHSGGRIATSDNLLSEVNDPSVQPVLLGLIEAIRYRAIALRDLNRGAEAEALTDYAAKVAAANNLGRASVYARLYQTSGTTASRSSTPDRALGDLGRSDAAFQEALPGTKPAAEAKLLRAGELTRAGQTGSVLSLCRQAVRTLIAISAGTSPELIAPCLTAYANGGSGAGIRAEMFQAAQIGQGSITSHQIAQASAALAENARDPEVGKALRQRDTAQRELDRLYRALDALGGGAASARSEEEMSRIRGEAEQRQSELAQAEATVRRLSPNYAQLVQDVTPARDVFAALRPNEAFIALFLSQHAGWAFALRDGDITISPVTGGIDTISPLVRKVRTGIEDQAGIPDIDSMRRLYGLTLGGIAHKLQGANALVIVPAGPLLSVPFEILLTGPADPARLAEAPWLLRQASITHVPAPANFVSLRKVTTPLLAQKPKWFGFGDFRKVSAAQVRAAFPDPHCARDRAALVGLPPLPGATAELQGVRKILGASPNDELLGDAFTADRVMSQDLKPYQILHFAAHALLPTDLECQSEASIVTSPPARGTEASGWLLTAPRLLGLELDASLVILSACNSGGGDGKSGESLSGLARSFFFARARSVMVSHWPVHDKVGAALVQLMVLKLNDKPGLGPTGALREAQLDLLGEMASGKLPAVLANPFFWAPFALIGEGGAGAAAIY